MDRVKLKTKSYETDMCVLNTSNNILYITLPGVSITEAAAVFGNPVETQHIEYGMDVYEGFTRLSRLVNEGTATRVNMEAEE